MDPRRGITRGIALGILAAALLAGGVLVTTLPREDPRPGAAPSSIAPSATEDPTSRPPVPSRSGRTEQPTVSAPTPSADGAPSEQGEGVIAGGPIFPVNEHGQTYGSHADAESPEDGPDLVAVGMEDGSTAYVHSSDLTRYDGAVPHPDEASRYAAKTQAMSVAWRARGFEYIPITAYASDGVTVLSTWTGKSL